MCLPSNQRKNQNLFPQFFLIKRLEYSFVRESLRIRSYLGEYVVAFVLDKFLKIFFI
jgi:hypothetical protein